MNTPTNPQPGPHSPATFAAYNDGVQAAVTDYRNRCKSCRMRKPDTKTPKCSSCYEEEAGRRVA